MPSPRYAIVTPHCPTWMRRIASITCLGGLMGGIPVALICAHAVPPLGHLTGIVTDPRGIRHYLGGQLSDEAYARTVACCAWLVWTWLVICVATEIGSVVRGKPTRRLPASRHAQALIAVLVGASLTILPSARHGSVTPRRDAVPVVLRPFHVQEARAHRVELMAVSRPEYDGGPGQVTPEQSRSSPGNSDAAVAATEWMYVVKPGDTLWAIAERSLGSPLRWREIADLNYGRPQPGGGRLTDAHWLFPGWTLMLPESQAPQALQAPQAPADILAEDAGSPQHDVLSRDGILLQPAHVVHLGSAGPTAPSPSNGAVRGSGRVTARGTHTAMHQHVPSPSGVIGYGLLGAGVVVLLDRMRRVQRRRRPTGLRIALPDGDLVGLERRLRAEADPEGAEVVDIGLRALVASCGRSGEVPPRLVCVRVCQHALELVLHPCSAHRIPREPFTSSVDGASWLLPRDAATLRSLREDEAVRNADPPFPSLVTLGHDGSGLVLVDLEQAASLAFEGDGARAAIETMALELATASWADQVDLILVGFDRELESLERVVHGASVSDVVPRIQRRVRERNALLTTVGRSANWEIRWTEGGDSWDLCVVMCSPHAVDSDRDGAALLARLAGEGGSGVAVVFGADTPPALCHVHAHDGGVELVVRGVTVRAQSVRQPEQNLLDRVSALVEVAGDLEGVLPSEPPYHSLAADAPIRAVEASRDLTVDAHSTAPSARVLAEGPRDDAGPEVEVRVLGPIDIVGAARPFTRAWAIELIVYLAMHPKGASTDQWATALWPDRVMAAASLHSTASAARRSLGTSSSGEDHLPRSHGRLSLGASVGTDWARFVALSEADDPAGWHRALELIRGRPFDGLRASDWVLLEGVGAHVEAVVVDLSTRFAEWCLLRGDPDNAEWSARQGLRVSAYDERLYRILMRTADAAGNPAGVESVMAELVRLVAEDVEPFDAVHPETLELYRALSRRAASFSTHR